jgi:hypothetical protein
VTSYAPLLQTALGGGIALVGAVLSPLVMTRLQRRAEDERRRLERARAVDEQQVDLLARLQESLLTWGRLMGRCWHDDQIRFRSPDRWDASSSNDLQETELETRREVIALCHRVLDLDVRDRVTGLLRFSGPTMPLTNHPTETDMASAEAHQTTTVLALCEVEELIGERWRALVSGRLAR